MPASSRSKVLLCNSPTLLWSLRRVQSVATQCTPVKSYLWIILFFFCAMLVFGFWGLDATNLALGTHRLI